MKKKKKFISYGSSLNVKPVPWPLLCHWPEETKNATFKLTSEVKTTFKKYSFYAYLLIKLN